MRACLTKLIFCLGKKFFGNSGLIIFDYKTGKLNFRSSFAQIASGCHAQTNITAPVLPQVFPSL
jgi:hypothetical protein